MQRVVRTKPKFGFFDRVGMAVDSFVGILAPGLAKKMRKSRIEKKFGSYKGADKSRLHQSWLPGGKSADEDLLPDLEDLRERSRDLNRNNPIAAGTTNTVTTNVIGTGIKPQSRIIKRAIPGMTDTLAAFWQQRCEAVWNKWALIADAGNRNDIYEIQALVDRQILENGEAFVQPLRLDDPGRNYALALDIIEADRVATPPGNETFEGRDIRAGVELGGRGEPVAYWVRKTHPGDMFVTENKDEYVRIPATNKFGQKNIIHLYHQMRPGQTRGVPFFAPAMSYFKHHAEYQEAELIAQRIAACYALIFETPDPQGLAEANADGENPDSQQLEEYEPGLIWYANTGEKVTQISPTRPSTQYATFIEQILRNIATSLGLPYELVAMDFSKTNYSSARAALMEARRYFRNRQNWMSRKFLQPVWDMLMEEAFLLGELQAVNDDFFTYKMEYSAAFWIAPGWDWVDPVKDAKATQIALDNGLVSHSEVIANKGGNWEDTFEQIAREKVRIKELEERFDIKLFENTDSAQGNEETEQLANEKEEANVNPEAA